MLGDHSSSDPHNYRHIVVPYPESQVLYQGICFESYRGSNSGSTSVP